MQRLTLRRSMHSFYVRNQLFGFQCLRYEVRQPSVCSSYTNLLISARRRIGLIKVPCQACMAAHPSQGQLVACTRLSTSSQPRETGRLRNTINIILAKGNQSTVQDYQRHPSQGQLNAYTRLSKIIVACTRLQDHPSQGATGRLYQTINIILAKGNWSPVLDHQHHPSQWQLVACTRPSTSSQPMATGSLYQTINLIAAKGNWSPVPDHHPHRSQRQLVACTRPPTSSQLRATGDLYQTINLILQTKMSLKFTPLSGRKLLSLLQMCGHCNM